jgi:hypothetical protein
VHIEDAHENRNASHLRIDQPIGAGKLAWRRDFRDRGNEAIGGRDDQVRALRSRPYRVPEERRDPDRQADAEPAEKVAETAIDDDGNDRRDQEELAAFGVDRREPPFGVGGRQRLVRLFEIRHGAKP